MDARDGLALLEAIAERADAIALGYFRSQALRVERKIDRTPVTQADLEIEEEARRIARARVPGIAVLGEEHGQEPDRGAGRLVVDPIDATANFARGIPIFATLLALEVEGELQAALVSAPALGTRWHALAGGGAWRGRRRLQVSGIAELADAQAFHGSLGGSETPDPPAGLVGLLAATRRQRGFGDFYQHVLVCEGAGEIAIDVGVNPWDVAPLILLAREAGGRSSGLDGSSGLDAGSLVTSNGRLHDAALRHLAAASEGRVAEPEGRAAEV